MRKLEFVEISPKNKDKLLAKYRYKTGFEKDQKKYDKLFEYEAKQVVHALPRLSKAEVALLEALRTEVRPTPKPEAKPEVVEPKPCSVDMSSIRLVLTLGSLMAT